MLTPSEVLALAKRAPRTWHTAALPVTLDAVRSRRVGIVYAATGSGKSYLQGAILRAIVPDSRFVDVIVVPTQALVEQMAADLREWGLEAGRYYGQKKEVRRVIVVCLPSVAVLAEDLALRDIRCRLAIIDECHRVGAARTLAALEALRPVTRIGFSATPIRTQKSSILRDLWPAGIMHSYTIADAIRDGAIVPPVVHAQGVTEDPNVASWNLIQAHAQGPTVVNALDVEDAEFWALHASGLGRPTLSIDGSMGKTERSVRLDMLLSGRADLSFVKLLTEGVDLPSLQTLVMRAQMGSVISYVQMMGRVLRTSPGKTCGIVLDVHDLWGRFGLLAFSDDMWAEEAEAAMASEAMREGGGGGERVLDPAAIVADLELKAQRLRAALLAAGHIQTTRVRGKGWRSENVTDRQEAVLSRWEDGRKSPARYLPEEHRETWRALVERRSSLSRGGAADVLDVGIGLQTVAREHKERTGAWWAGVRELEVG